MKLIWEVQPHDVARLQAFLEQHWHDPLVQRRMALNVQAIKQPIAQAEFWQILVFCLLTTQQRSGPSSPVTRFILTDPFPLAFHICAEQADIRHFAQATLSNFGGLRFSNRLAAQIAKNLSALQQGLWTTTFDILEQLRHEQTVQAERIAANFIDSHFDGFGPKQSRNLLQALRLSQYEIPIDSRITKWLNAFGFPIQLSPAGLADPHYYQFVSEGFQQLCQQSDVIPCILDAAIFSSYDISGWTADNTIW